LHRWASEPLELKRELKQLAQFSTVAGANNFIGFTLATATTNYAVTVTGGTAATAATTVTGSGTAALIAQANNGTTAFTVPTPTVGTIVVRAFAFTAGVQAATATSTLTITVAAPAIAAGTINVAASTSFITDSATLLSATLATAASNVRGATLTADSTIGASRTAAATLGTSTPVALIQVKLMDTQLTPAVIAARTLTAVITGPGLLVGTGASDAALAAPAAASVTSTTDSNGIAVFAVYSAGLGGVGTIEISNTSAATNVKTVVATETVTFHGGVAKLTPLVSKGNIPNSGSAYTAGSSTDYVFRLTLTDSDGYAVRSSTTITATAADATLVSAVSCGSTPSTTGRVYCTATGVAGKTGKTTVTFKTGAASTFNLVETTADVTVVSPKAATIVFSGTADAEIGGTITYTVEAKGADGLPVPDGALVLDYMGGASPVVAGGAMKDFASTANAGLSANNPDALFAGVKFKDGKATDTVQAPFGATTIAADFYAAGFGVATSGGTYFATAAAANTITTVKTVVSNSGAQAAADAAAEATDAANAATDAANAAAEAADAATAAAQDAADAVAALSTQVADMMTALT
jgi:trimeric autotransporter adhesin